MLEDITYIDVGLRNDAFVYLMSFNIMEIHPWIYIPSRSHPEVFLIKAMLTNLCIIYILANLSNAILTLPDSDLSSFLYLNFNCKILFAYSIKDTPFFIIGINSEQFSKIANTYVPNSNEVFLFLLVSLKHIYKINIWKLKPET